MKLLSILIRRRSVFILPSILILAVLLSLADGNAAQKRGKAAAAPVPPPTPQQEPAPAIPLSQIMAQADEARVRLEQVSSRLSPSEELTALEQTLHSQQRTISLQQKETEEVLDTSLDLSELGELESDWKSLGSQDVAMQGALAAQIKAAEEDIRYIDAQTAQWESILSQVQNAPEFQTISKKARDLLNEARTIRPKVNERISNLLALQKQAFQQSEVVTAILGKIALAKKQFRRGIWEADSPPLWKLREGQTSETLRQILHRSLRLDWIRAKRFFAANPVTAVAPLLLFLVLSLVAFVGRRRVPRWAEKHPDLNDSLDLLKHPFSLSLLAVLTASVLVITGLPSIFRTAALLLFIVPILQFVPRLTRPAYRPPLYALIVFGLMLALWNLIEASPMIELSVIVLLTLTAISVIGLLSRRAKKLIAGPHRRSDKIILSGINTGLFLLFLSFLGVLFGYITLSQVLRSGAVLGAYYAVALFAVFTCIVRITTLAWAMRRDKTFSTLRHYETVIGKWGGRLLVLSVCTLWLSSTLQVFTVREFVLNVLSKILTSSISLGTLNFSLGDILTFVLLFVLGVIVAKVIQAILREDVLVTLNMQQGLPYAISTIVYYVLLLVGFLFALAAAGVELSKFTLLTGAFGVGAGFGMQNILNNFISGIILLFERPIRAGDIAEVGASIGTVEKIGSRSSKLLNWQGATVIVPNSTLISDQVINWSLVGGGRRIELRFKADYSADPEQVIKLLASVAAANPKVLPSPPPRGLFLGYGESSLDFELQYWSPLAIIPTLQSEVALAVSAAMSEAGIKVPLPQRELLVRSYESPISKPSSEPEAEK